MTRTTSSRKKPRPVRAAATGELLVEIGTEELPYEFIAPALDSFRQEAARLLSDARLSCGSLTTLGTPRRLVLIAEGLALHQAPVVKEAMGPSKAVGFDQAGRPTKAAIGFATAQGLSVDRLQVRQTPKGEYLFAIKEDGGRPAKAVLAEVLPQLIGKLTFPKAMKWNETGVRFARPVRWLVALLQGQVLPVQTAGVKAGGWTYGHRVVGGGRAIAVRDVRTYRQALERHGVLVDPVRRRVVVQEQLARLCAKAGVQLNADEALLDQAVYTTEWPYAVMGRFKPEYLAVPAEILITSMKNHQGFFSVRDKHSGALAPYFIAVANNHLKDMSVIRAGNERVLAARLADAKFFFEEDRKVRLEARAKKLDGVTFHQKLGTMAQKQERVAILAGVLARMVQPQPEGLVQACERAGALCKTDLLTGIVGEFPELQGIMGGEYAKHDGEPEAVCQALREHYLPRSLEGDLPRTPAGLVLSLADRLDTLTAFFYVGIVPTGSEDPFGLRRHATAVVRIVLEGLALATVGEGIDQARALVAAAGFKAAASIVEVRQRLVDFLFERVRHYGRTVRGLRDDVMNAVLKVADRQALDLRDLFQRMTALQTMTGRADFDALIVGFKRAHRLVEKESWDRQPVIPDRFQHPAEGRLHAALEDRDKMLAHLHAGRYADALEVLAGLKAPIDAFFDAVMVNAEDSAVRNNRLSLLKAVDDWFLSFADFSLLVVQGS